MKTPMRRILMPLSLLTVAIGAAMTFPPHAAQAQSTATILYSFGASTSDGIEPESPLIVDSNGNLLGTTNLGGANSVGTAFSFSTANGTLDILHNFGAATNDGTYPQAGLLSGASGIYYGTTNRGGTYGDGVLYEVTSTGGYDILYNFGKTATDGQLPASSLVADASGKLYGTAFDGGTYGYGTIYKATITGGYSSLYSFGVNDDDGETPNCSLLRAANGNFYGMTRYGGLYDCGTIFELSSSGAYSKLYDFGDGYDDGANPYGALMQDAAGNFYGTTLAGGDYDDGTVFKYSTSGELTLLHSFGSVVYDGSEPDCALVQGADGNLYGTTASGGEFGNDGTIFRLTTTGTYQVLYSFGDGTGDGDYPYEGLVQGASNTFYGVTTGGGANSDGTIYSIPSNLPFIESFSPNSGTVGTVVTINGTGFTGTSAVAFGGTPAASSSISVTPTQITATVPAGAASGSIYIETPEGEFYTPNKFYVSNPAVPTITSFTPASGPVGASVTITGTGFTGATVVKFNTTAAATFTVVSATSITATVPSGATTGKISVTTAGGTATSSSSFTVTTVSAPTITSFTPTSGTVGSSVTITGTNFTGASAVKFNGTSATTFTVVSATSIKATVPTGATTGKIAVMTAGGTATSTATFTVTAATAPTITSFTPTSGPVKTDVSITGTGFTGATSVTFNGVAATTFNVDSATLIKALVPAGATSGVITVTTPSGTATSTSSFTVN